jgi:hypothetical protein
MPTRKATAPTARIARPAVVGGGGRPVQTGWALDGTTNTTRQTNVINGTESYGWREKDGRGVGRTKSWRKME